jgi:hypothetical protein
LSQRQASIENRERMSTIELRIVNTIEAGGRDAF